MGITVALSPEVKLKGSEADHFQLVLRSRKQSIYTIPYIFTM
jgi:hypothetical protein